jgi:hypothetical protein
VIGAEIMSAFAIGTPVRRGAVSRFARPSFNDVIRKMYFPGRSRSFGSVTEVVAVPSKYLPA